MTTLMQYSFNMGKLRAWQAIITVGLLLVLACEPSFALCVSRSKANLREKPSSRAKITWVVGRHTPLVFLKQKGNWFQVSDQEGKKHWIYGSSVTQDYRCAAVKYRYAYLRTEPSSKAPLASYRHADRYTPFKRLKTQGDWQQVQDQFGQSYWISYNSLWLPQKLMRVRF